MCCSVLQCVAYEVQPCVTDVLQLVAVCCSMLQCVAVCCSMLPARCKSPNVVCCMVLHIKYIDVQQTKEVVQYA